MIAHVLERLPDHASLTGAREPMAISEMTNPQASPALNWCDSGEAASVAATGEGGRGADLVRRTLDQVGATVAVHCLAAPPVDAEFPAPPDHTCFLQSLRCPAARPAR
jgi:hypothetical protein